MTDFFDVLIKDAKFKASKYGEKRESEFNFFHVILNSFLTTLIPGETSTYTYKQPIQIYNYAKKFLNKELTNKDYDIKTYQDVLAQVLGEGYKFDYILKKAYDRYRKIYEKVIETDAITTALVQAISKYIKDRQRNQHRVFPRLLSFGSSRFAYD